MSTRAGLIVLQAIGALSIIPYPFILLANVMSIAAPRQTPLGASPFILMSVYPVIWIALYMFAWRALARGSTGVAFALSSVPALVCLGGGALFLSGTRTVATFNNKAAEDARKQVEPINPLLWTILCVGGKDRFAGVTPVTVEQALKAIETNAALVNVAVPPYGTPLRNALLNVAFNIDGTLGNRMHEPASRQQDLIRVVRSLVAHGARLEPEERSNIWRSWQLRRAMFDGPVNTGAENPLVWKIVVRKSNDTDQFTINGDELRLINKPTRLHGTPLYAALVTGGYYIFPGLIKAGARLSTSEERDPAAARALKEMFEKRPELRGTYGR
jgi:hypothetical protein